MAHFLQYRLGPADDGKEVLFLMQKVLGLTTKKVRSVKHEERGILLDEERVTVRASSAELEENLVDINVNIGGKRVEVNSENCHIPVSS